MDNITIRISKKEKADFKKAAELNGAKMSSVLKMYIKEYTNKGNKLL